MIRVDGQVMTEVRYREYMQEQRPKPNLLRRMAQGINSYFFGRAEVSLSDCLWFYGFMGFVGVLTMIVALIGRLGS